MVFENGVKNIQAAAYNGARTVCGFRYFKIESKVVNISVGHFVEAKRVHGIRGFSLLGK